MKKQSRAVIIVLLTIAAAVIGAGCCRIDEAIKEHVKPAYEKQTEEERRSQEYAQNLWLAADSMFSGAVDAEDCCNLIRRVWSNAIYEKEDSDTDMYTKPEGYFVEDFNDALENLFGDEDFCMRTDEVAENQRTVISMIRKLQNPPKEYEKTYEALIECYEVYLTLTNLAINPTGSLNSFSDDFSNADTEFFHCYQMLAVYLPD